MGYSIRGLSPEPFRTLYGLSQDALAEHGAIRMTVDAKPGFPDRVTLEDVEPGASVLLVNHEHLPAKSPYRSRHAIFVLEGAAAPAVLVDALPPVFAGRILSLRAFDEAGMMIDADLASGPEIEPLIARLFDNERAAFLHAHNARRGCFAARIDRR